MNTRGKKYWKGLLYSSTIIAMLGTPVSSLAAIVQNNQTEELTKEQEALLGYQDAINAYTKARSDYQEAKDNYENRLSEYDSLAATAKAAKAELESKKAALLQAEESYKPQKETFETTKAEYERLREIFEAEKDPYETDRIAYVNAKEAYEAMVPDYENAIYNYETVRDAYYSSMDEYEELQEGLTGVNGLIAKYDAAKTTYSDALEKYETANSNYESSKLAYQNAVNDYNTFLGQYEEKQLAYQGLLSEYDNMRSLYTQNLADYDNQLIVLADLKETLRQKNEIYQASRDAYLPLEEEYNEAVSNNQSVIDEYTNLKTAYEAEVAKVKEQIATYEEELAVYEPLRIAYNESKVTYEETVSEYQRLTNELQTAKPNYDKALLAYNSAQGIYNKKVADYNKIKSDYESELAGFNGRLADYNKLLDTYKQNYEAAKKILDAYAAGSAEYNAAKAAYDENKKKYDDIYPEYLKVKLEADDLNSHFFDVSEEFKKTTDDFLAVEKNYQAVKSTYDNLMTKKKQQEELYISIESEYRINSDAYDKVKAQYDSLIQIRETANQEVARIQGLKAELDIELEKANAQLGEVKDKYDAAESAYQIADGDYRVAMSAYEDAFNKADTLLKTKNDLETEFASLNGKYTNVFEEVEKLNGQKTTLETDLTEITAQFEKAGGLLTIANTEFGLANGAYDLAFSAKTDAEARIEELQEKLPDLEQQYSDLGATYLSLKNRYDDEVYPAYDAATKKYEPLLNKYNELFPQYQDLAAMLTEGSEFMNQFNTANDAYNEIVALNESAKNAYEDAENAITEFKANPDVAAIEELYDIANDKFKDMSDKYEAAVEEVNKFNNNILNAEEYVNALAAKVDADEAMGTVKGIYAELNSLLSDYPVPLEDFSLNGFYLEDPDYFDGFLNSITVWETNHRSEVDIKISEAKSALTDYKDKMAIYKTFYETYQQNTGIFPVDGEDFRDFSESTYNQMITDLGEMTKKLDRNTKNSTVFIEIIEDYEVLISQYEQYVTDLDFTFEKTIDPDWGIIYTTSPNEELEKKMKDLDDYLQMFKMENGELSINWSTLKGLPSEYSFENITVPDEAVSKPILENLMNYYKDYGIDILGEAQVYMGEYLKVIDKWTEDRRKFVESTNQKIIGTDITFDSYELERELSRARTIVENFVNGKYFEVVDHNYSSIMDRTYRWDRIDRVGWTLLDQIGSGVDFEQANAIYSPNEVAELVFEPDINFFGINFQENISVMDVPEPTKITVDNILNRHADLPDLTITPATISAEGVELPKAAELEEPSETKPTVTTEWDDKREPQTNDEDLGPLTPPTGPGPLTPIETNTPTENKSPEIETTKPSEVVNPIKPDDGVKEPKPDMGDLLTGAEELNPIELEPIEPEGKVEKTDEIKVNFDSPNKPVSNNPVAPVKPGYVESPRPLTPPKEPTNETPEPPIEDPENPGGGDGGREDVDGGNTGRNNRGGNTPTTSGNRVSGSQVTNTNLPNTSRETLPKTNDVNNPWYQALGASIIGALGLSGLHRRKKAKADKK